MKKNFFAFVLLGILLTGSALVSAQEVYADTESAYEIGYIQGQADYSPKKTAGSMVNNASRRYADQFVNNKGFGRNS